MESQCPNCHISIRPTDYFCFNCGKNLKPKPLSTSIGSQLLVYIGSLLLPPMGIIWGLRYLREKTTGAKVIGIIAILLTIIILILATKLTIDLVNTINDQVNSQMNNILNL